MKKLAALVLALALFSPAAAEGPGDILNSKTVQQVLDTAAQQLDLNLPTELITQGQMDVFREMSNDAEFGTQLTSLLLQAALKGDMESSLPTVMESVNPDQRRKLRLTRPQTDFLYSVLQRVNK